MPTLRKGGQLISVAGAPDAAACEQAAITCSLRAGGDAAVDRNAVSAEIVWLVDAGNADRK